MECYQINNKKGFTIVELMVAITLFSMLAVGAVGAIVTASISARSTKADAIFYANTVVFFDVLEKDLESATAIGCNQTIGSNCNTGSSFIIQNGDGVVKYGFQSGQITRDENGISNPTINLVGSSVSDFKVRIIGANSGDLTEPLLFVSGEFLSLTGKTYFISRSFNLENLEI